MRKIFTFFAAMLMTLSVSAASYGILVNDSIYFAGTKTDDFEGFQQYLAHVPLKAGDHCQLYDKDNKASWAVASFPQKRRVTICCPKQLMNLAKTIKV